MQHVQVQRKLWLVSALLLLGCGRSCREPTAIDAMAEGTTLPVGDHARFVAESVPAFVGRLERETYAGGRAGDPPYRTVRWVVPLVDPGASLAPDGTVHAWLASRPPAPRGTDPRTWLDKVAAEFDGKPQVQKVAARAGSRESRVDTYREAITDAEDRYGLTSHPDAPVFLFP